MKRLIKQVLQCKHHKKKKLKPNEVQSPNPREMYKNNDLGEKEDKENAATKISLWKLLKINNCEIYTISL